MIIMVSEFLARDWEGQFLGQIEDTLFWNPKPLFEENLDV